MTIALAHKAAGHLKTAVSSSDTSFVVDVQVFEDFVRVTGDDIYVMLRGPVNRELVKIDVAGSVSPVFTVARGQGGTIAVAWPVGALIFPTTHEDHYNSITQAGYARTIDYNPNEILSPNFAGEKIYQSSPAGCERWWKSFDGVNPYWDIITGAPCDTELYEDIGWTYNLLLPGPTWEAKFDNTKWEQSAAEPYGVWNAGQSRWEAEAYPPLPTNDWLSITPIGGWEVGYEPDAFRVTTPVQFVGGPPCNFNIYLKFGTYWWNIGVKNSLDIITINAANYSVYGDISGMRVLFETTKEYKWLTNIEFRIP